MNIFQLIIRWFLRLKWWFILLPLLIALAAIYLTRNLNQRYSTDMTIYTGVLSNYGSNPGDANAVPDWNMANNSIQNIINTIQSKETLKRLSIVLYARLMINGDANQDNIYIKAKHYQELYAITPPAVLQLIDKDSEAKTVQNLLDYDKPQRDNFVYGLINWDHPYFSYSALKENIKIKRLDNSDILQISYETNDPGVSFQTLQVLSEIFGIEYEKLQFGNTNNVIKYFEGELERIGRELRLQEDSLTDYNVENRVINYDKQTESIALLDKEFSMRAQEVFFMYNNTQAAIRELESRLDANITSIKNNAEFLERLDGIADANYSISRARTRALDSIPQSDNYLNGLQSDLTHKEDDFRGFMGQYVSQKYTRDGYPNSNFVSQWIDELIKFKKAEAEVQVVKDFEADLDTKYTQYSPIGSVLKRKERSINFTEQSYLSILSSLNAARLRLKSLEMNSAVLKVINPPTYPLSSLPSKRKMIVAGSYFGTLMLLFGFFLLLELLDRTLRDKLRTERLTQVKVVGAFPNARLTKNKAVVEQKIVHVIANHIYGFYNPDRALHLVNIVSLAPLQEPNRVTEMLASYWAPLGLQAKAFYADMDFKSDVRDYLVGQAWKAEMEGYDISLVQHAPLTVASIPRTFLHEAMVTLVLLDANSVFNTEEEMLMNSLKERVGDKPIVICLINAERYVIEEFTGLLPPYTFLRRLGYRLMNFGLTARG